MIKLKTESTHKGDTYAGRMPSVNLSAQDASAIVDIIIAAAVITIRKEIWPYRKEIYCCDS